MLTKCFVALSGIAATGAFLAGTYFLLTDTTLRNGWLVATFFAAGLFLVALFMLLTRRD